MPTVSQKGQVTIPVAVREELGIHPGDEVTFERTADGYVLRKEVADDRFEKWRGAISTDRTMAERMADLRGRPLDEEGQSAGEGADGAAADGRDGGGPDDGDGA